MPFLFLASFLSKEFIGSYVLGILVGLVVLFVGWNLAYPRRKHDEREAEWRLIEDSGITEKSEQEDLIWICDKCGTEVKGSDDFCPKCGGKFEEELLHKDDKIILEESKQYLKYRPHECPYCNSTEISESVIQVAKNEKEMKLLGYSYLWEGKCASCSTSWYSVEGGKQVSKHDEPTKSGDEMQPDFELETNYCYKCGRGITSEMVFCPKCGHKLS